MNNNEKVFDVIRTEEKQLGRFQFHMDTILENGKEYPFSYICEPNSVGVLAFYKGYIILERQYRHTIKRYEYEIPGGALDKGENPEDAAKRELLEETGFVAKRTISLGSWYMAPGVSTAENYMFAIDCEESGNRTLEPLEYISVELVSKDEFVKMMKDGRIKQSLAFVGWQKYLLSDEKL